MVQNYAHRYIFGQNKSQPEQSIVKGCPLEQPLISKTMTCAPQAGLSIKFCLITCMNFLYFASGGLLGDNPIRAF